MVGRWLVTVWKKNCILIHYLLPLKRYLGFFSWGGDSGREEDCSWFTDVSASTTVRSAKAREDSAGEEEDHQTNKPRLEPATAPETDLRNAEEEEDDDEDSLLSLEFESWKVGEEPGDDACDKGRRVCRWIPALRRTDGGDLLIKAHGNIATFLCVWERMGEVL